MPGYIIDGNLGNMNNCQIQIVENLVLKASEILDVPVSAIKDKNKKEEYCIARALVWVACKNNLCLPFRDIAQLFNRRHPTILEAYRNMRDEIEVNKDRMIIYKELVSS